MDPGEKTSRTVYMHPSRLQLKRSISLNLVYVLLETFANGAVKEITEVGF